ncbi:hypothetical protein Pan258_06750 [Symmachiella dynata]|nr:hypothetical protein Pan258_06750 [Symmachiella dynata]
MTMNSTNLILLFVLCGGLVAVLLINALRLRRRDGGAVVDSNVENTGTQKIDVKTPGPALWRRTILIALLGTGMLLLLPLATALHAAEPVAANRLEAFVRTLVFLAPLMLCVFYGCRLGRPDVK